MPTTASPTLALDNQSLQCRGEWTLTHNLAPIIAQIPKLKISSAKIKIDASQLNKLDSAGAWVLYQLVHQLEQQGKTVQLVGLQPGQQRLLTLVQDESANITYPLPALPRHNWIERIGKTTVVEYLQLTDLITFTGEVWVIFLRLLRRIGTMQWKSFLNVIDETGYQALGIVGLLCALIGVVVAYQLGQQLKIYGANIYIVSLLGVGVLQEFAPLITAIIVAGRTGSAFAAQIGAMQVNQEIDALRTMGLSPVERLVIPKVLGLLVAMPLLTIWADIFGVFGGMVVAKHMLDINYYNFLIQFPNVVQLSTFFNGLIKTPVFATIIAGVGCFEGFKVEATADSVGRQTTKSVVLAIFFIIVADAIFSIILPWQNV